MRSVGQTSRVGITIAIGLIPLLHATDDSPSPVSLRSAAAIQGRALLRAGRLAEAEHAVRSAHQAGDESAWSLAGELSIRRGDFAAAHRDLEKAAALNESNARAWWGLGRIEQLHFRPDAARDLFARAYRLDPADPEILISYLNYVSEPAARALLLRNAVALLRDSEPERARHALAQLQTESRLAGRVPGALASAYTTYRLPLTGFHPTDSNQHGLLVTARINGGRPLRLLLDTGARVLMLYRSVASNLGLEPLAASELGGFGSGRTAESTLSLARTVTFDDLEFRDCQVDVSSRELAGGVDGVLPPSLFARFVIRIDPKARVLELTPLELAPHGEEDHAASQNALDLDRLLLVRAEMANKRQGWFLLDTGAAYTAVAADHSGSGSGVAITGVQGTMGAFRVAPMTFRVAGQLLADTEAVAMDLRGLSQREGVEIAGILGYSTLSRWPVTIDFRSGQVRIGNKR
jgi:Flp pilus assembly protein TadD